MSKCKLAIFSLVAIISLSSITGCNRAIDPTEKAEKEAMKIINNLDRALRDGQLDKETITKGLDTLRNSSEDIKRVKELEAEAQKMQKAMEELTKKLEAEKNKLQNSVPSNDRSREVEELQKLADELTKKLRSLQQGSK